jgi:hypothetical protein
MNRKERRASKSSARKAVSLIDPTYDIQIDPKVDRCIMIFANSHGREIVGKLFPDVDWTTDELFASFGHSDDWLYTHIRVTKLPPGFEATTPLASVSPDALGFAVAAVLQKWAEPGRVIFWTGAGADSKPNRIDIQFKFDEAWLLSGEYMPNGTYEYKYDAPPLTFN